MEQIGKAPNDIINLDGRIGNVKLKDISEKPNQLRKQIDFKNTQEMEGTEKMLMPKQ